MTYFILWMLVVLGMAAMEAGRETVDGGRPQVAPTETGDVAACVHTAADCEECRESLRCGMRDRCI